MLAYRQVHLDFHTSECIPGIGMAFDKKQFQDALKAGHVNSVTIFAKCHHGWSYYPTKVNEMHPHLDFDLLKAQLDACKEIGVKSPVYLSAGFDEKMAREHSDWLIRNLDESTDYTKDFSEAGYHRMCYNTPYLDKLLAEIDEVMRMYNPDGIFLDISTVMPCTCSYCRKSIVERGKDYRDPAAVLEQAEITFAEYTRRVEEIIHRHNPDCTIFHNAGHITRGRRDIAHANSHLELESLPTGGWGYDHFPMSAAYVMNLGMEYLGMTGKFHTTWGEFGGFKHPNALRYETGLSLAFGAKCSIGDQLHPNGKMNEKTYQLIGKAYEEVEAKEPWCYDAKNICDIAVLGEEVCLTEAASRDTVHNGDIGANRVLLNGHYLYTFIDKEVDFNKFKVLILPDTVRLNQELANRLDAYLKQGGKLLLSGESGLWEQEDAFALETGAVYCGKNSYRPNYCLFEKNGAAEVIYQQSHLIEPVDGEVWLYGQNSYFNRDLYHFSSHQHTPNNEETIFPAAVRKQNIIYIGWNVFSEYGTIGSLQAKEIITRALDRLLVGNKAAKASLPDRGVLTLTKQEKEKRYMAHLLFAHTTIRGTFDICGEKKTVEAIEDIVPLCNTKICVNVPEKIHHVYLAPQMTELEFESCEDGVFCMIPEMECHQIVVFDYE